MRYRSPRTPRRGVTLVEMLVAVTLLVLMMTIIVTIFASATGALSGLQTYQQLDGDLRQLDITIRQDLIGVTARMTPPLNPRDNLGYFEYAENAFADIQLEDTDDYIRFTAKAPEGQPFIGRAWLDPTTNVSRAAAPQPVMVTSDLAEIIYFLRNGNLYRRVLLVAPNRQASVNTFMDSKLPLNEFQSSVLGGHLMSWQGVNDLSAHPAPSGSFEGKSHPIVLNTLSDLTNREYRYGYSRYANDYYKNMSDIKTPDGIPDDQNGENDDGTGAVLGDGVTDYPPVLYSQIFAANPPLVSEPTLTNFRVNTGSNLAFPYLFPRAYSTPDTYTGATTGAGWIHSTEPLSGAATTPALALAQLNKINHSPLERGELPLTPPSVFQTSWIFPTWKETLLPNWNDPYTLVSTGAATTGTQPVGLGPLPANASPALIGDANALPPMTSLYRNSPQPFADGAGSDLFSASTSLPPVGASSAPVDTIALWQAAWEDDLIMTGVRSFDVKIYDNSYPGYVDLGWGDDLRLQSSVASPPAKPFLAQANGLQFISETPPIMDWTNGSFFTVTQTFAHEGRIPPLVKDQRFDAQYPAFNVGDDEASVQRLRRVWDTWSTDYTQVPATGFNPRTKLPVGPPWSAPIYPSYPPPYPVAMRGIQIQIRVVDPRNEKVKTLTIRQDFSDKL